jgi:hypothetical protein
VIALPAISFGLDVRRPRSLETRGTNDVLLGIQSGAWQDTIARVRSLPPDSAEQKTAKLALPYATWAGRAIALACGVCAYTAFQAMQDKKTGWLFVFITAAIVLNPIAPLRLKRETWGIVDAAAAVLLLLSIAVMDIRKPKP